MLTDIIIGVALSVGLAGAFLAGCLIGAANKKVTREHDAGQ